MTQIQLSEEEQRALSEVLESAMPQLEVEIHRTDSLEFKEALTHRREVLQRLMTKVQEPEPAH